MSKACVSKVVHFLEKEVEPETLASILIEARENWLSCLAHDEIVMSKDLVRDLYLLRALAKALDPSNNK